MTSRFARQSFLGPRAERNIASTTFGVVGLGGGGSHVVQQLAHVGARSVVLYDPDRIEESNLNRLVGGTLDDVAAGRLKTDIAKRTFRNVAEGARVEAHATRWQENPAALKLCNVIFGCVDSLRQRAELETIARAHLISYIDIGLGVSEVQPDPPRMAGQIVTSIPGRPCMRCLGFLTEERLAKEARGYGEAGGLPQVVWGNGVLASIAVGIAVDLVTGWTAGQQLPYYLSYDANLGTVTPAPWLRQVVVPRSCEHFPAAAVGEVRPQNP